MLAGCWGAACTRRAHAAHSVQCNRACTQHTPCAQWPSPAGRSRAPAHTAFRTLVACTGRWALGGTAAYAAGACWGLVRGLVALIVSVLWRAALVGKGGAHAPTPGTASKVSLWLANRALSALKGRCGAAACSSAERTVLTRYRRAQAGRAPAVEPLSDAQGARDQHEAAVSKAPAARSGTSATGPVQQAKKVTAGTIKGASPSAAAVVPLVLPTSVDARSDVSIGAVSVASTGAHSIGSQASSVRSRSSQSAGRALVAGRTAVVGSSRHKSGARKPTLR